MHAVHVNYTFADCCRPPLSGGGWEDVSCGYPQHLPPSQNALPQVSEQEHCHLLRSMFGGLSLDLDGILKT